MIYTTGTNLLAPDFKELCKEVAYLPEKACDTALVTLAGAVFNCVVRRFGI